MSRPHKKKPEEGHEPSHERWLVSYADFITLMFAFFTILYATSEKNVEKTMKFQQSIQKFLIKAGSLGAAGSRINQAEQNNSPIEAPIPTFRRAKSEDFTDYKKAAVFLEDKLSEKDRKNYLIDVSADELGVRLVVSTRKIFSRQSAKFSQSALPFIDRLGDLIAEMNQKVLIESHVAKGEKGEYDSPWDLASARATNFLRYISKTHRIAPESLIAASRGDSRPLSENRDSPANSRLELLFLYDDNAL
jgi:chemotaxis protein MotB